MRASRLLIVAGVLLAGLCGAWPFRQRASTLARPPAAAIGVELTLRRQDVLLKPSGASDQSPALELEASIAGPRTRGAGKSQLASLESLTPPPELPVAFQPRSEALDRSRKQTGNEAKDLPAASRFTRPRSYRLRDGDTLEKLAERFLGSRERAGEIYEANRQALSRPDLLPVGTTITIPPRDPSSVSSSTANELTPANAGL